MKNKILVTGGTGQVGEELKSFIPHADYIGSKECDLTNEESVDELFAFNNYETVIHLAAKVGGIMDNLNNPVDFFEKNVLMNTNVVKQARIHKVKNFIGILSTCIYPEKVKSYPIHEHQLHDGIPPKGNLSYGYAKRSMAIHIDAVNQQYKTNYNYIIPTNLYGISKHEDPNTLHFVNALVKKIVDANRDGRGEIVLFGDGTPRRQFIHARDLARIIAEMYSSDIHDNFNVAGDDNLTIREMAEIALTVTGNTHLKITFDTTKPNGQLRKDVSNKKLKKIFPNFKFTKFEDGINELYNHYVNVF